MRTVLFAVYSAVIFAFGYSVGVLHLTRIIDRKIKQFNEKRNQGENQGDQGTSR